MSWGHLYGSLQTSDTTWWASYPTSVVHPVLPHSLHGRQQYEPSGLQLLLDQTQLVYAVYWSEHQPNWNDINKWFNYCTHIFNNKIWKYQLQTVWHRMYQKQVIKPRLSVFMWEKHIFPLNFIHISIACHLPPMT